MAIEEVMKVIAISIGIANICLLLGLLYIYVSNYKNIKSEFTLGLVIFASFFLLQNIFMVAVIALSTELDKPPMGGFMLIELIALAILFKITWK